MIESLNTAFNDKKTVTWSTTSFYLFIYLFLFIFLLIFWYYQNTLHVLLNIPRTGNYRMLIKYTNNGLEVQANTAIKYKNTSRSLAGELFNSSITLSYSCVSCRGVINDKLFLKKGAWNVNITTTRTANQQLELVKHSSSYTFNFISQSSFNQASNPFHSLTVRMYLACKGKHITKIIWK